MRFLTKLKCLRLHARYAGEIDCNMPYYEQCHSTKLFREIPREMEDFMASCPGLLSYTKCVTDYDIKCLKDDERRFKQLEKYENLYSFFDEVCKEGSALNEVVKTKLRCFNETFSNTNCNQEREDFLNPYETEIQLDEFTTTHVIPERVHCLSEMLEAKCIVDDITKNCGLRAKRLIGEFYRRTELIDLSCPPHYREGLLEDIDEFNLTEDQKSFAISELLRMKVIDEVHLIHF
ncbi:unnamed protein product [Larinioides sclopetarius]|uniref:DUF19 domain-containing protein n=1 Tax=Larinioides sclopetarius TaxID=280406 RepID=A0AAV2BNK8_9ARAC